MFAIVVLPWLHYVSVLLMAGAAVAQIYLLKLAQTPDAIRLLPRVDRFYGISAALVLFTGLARVWHGGKGPDYYWHNGMFHGVLTLFIVAAAVSLIPTLRYIRWRKVLEGGGALPEAREVARTKGLVHMQLSFMVLVALLIVLVAKGVVPGA